MCRFVRIPILSCTFGNVSKGDLFKWPNETVTLRFIDDDTETYLGGTCIFKLTHKFNFDLNNNSILFPIYVNPETGEAEFNLLLTQSKN